MSLTRPADKERRSTNCWTSSSMTGKSFDRIYERGRTVDVRQILITTHQLKNVAIGFRRLALPDGLQQTWAWFRGPTPMKRSSSQGPDAPLCSICIANYNGEGIISDCLDSIYHRKRHRTFEIIVHDDASTDNSVQYLRKHYPQVTIIESDVNVGFCISNNRMVDRARGEYVLLLNNDAAVETCTGHAA